MCVWGDFTTVQKRVILGGFPGGGILGGILGGSGGGQKRVKKREKTRVFLGQKPFQLEHKKGGYSALITWVVKKGGKVAPWSPILALL